MKQINFLPPSIRQKEQQRRRLPLYVVAGLAALVAVGAFWSVWGAQEKATATQLAQAREQDQERVAALEKQSQEAQADSGTATRVSLINSLSAHEIEWPVVFTRVGLLVEKDVHLTTVSLAPSTNALTVKVNGEAPSNVSFATYVENLKATKGITDFKIDTYAYTPTTGKVSFALSYGLPLTDILYQRKP